MPEILALDQLDDGLQVVPLGTEARTLMRPAAVGD